MREVILFFDNKILAPILVFCVSIVFASFCSVKSSADEPNCSSEKHTSYFTPSYFREYDTGWERWKHGFQEGLGEVEINGKWGFIDSSGQIIIQPKFNDVLGFHEGIGMTRSGAISNSEEAGLLGLAGQWMHIDKKGQPLYGNSDFYADGNFSEGLASVYLPRKWGIISLSMGKYGYINKKGEMIIPAKYDFAESFSEGLAAFEDSDGKCGYINTKGETVIEPRYDGAGGFSEGLAFVSIAGKCGFIDKQGDEVIPLQYDLAEDYSEGLSAVRKDGKWGYINKSGHVVISFKFDKAESFSEDCAAVVVDGKIGYINRGSEYVIEPKFEHYHYWQYRRRGVVGMGTCFAPPFVSSFSESLAAVMVGKKWGYINKKGEFVIEPKFDLAGRFTEGFAKVAVGDKLGYIDKQGKYICEPTR